MLTDLERNDKIVFAPKIEVTRQVLGQKMVGWNEEARFGYVIAIDTEPVRDTGTPPLNEPRPAPAADICDRRWPVMLKDERYDDGGRAQ